MTAVGAPPVSIVGAGNWLIASDCIGPRVLELVDGRYGADVELCHVGSSGLALLDHLHGQELLLVVDACALDRGVPGDVCVIEPDLDGQPTRESSVHQIGPVETLMVAKHLFPDQLPRRVRLVLVETNGIDSEVFEEACHKVVRILDEQIALIRAPETERQPARCAGLE